MAEHLDGDIVTERTWSVGWWRPGGSGSENYDTTQVTAATVEIVDGALVFRNEQGELVRAYGPTGWDEVDRA